MRLYRIFFTALTLSGVAWADYVTPEGNIQIGPNVYARMSTAEEIKKYNIAEAVIELYNRDIKAMDKSITVVRSDDDCIILFVDTKNGHKNFINQIFFENEKCLKN